MIYSTVTPLEDNQYQYYDQLTYSSIESKVSKNPKVVLLNPSCCVSHKLNSLLLQMLEAIEIIVQRPIQSHPHGIDGEVTAESVQFPILGKVHDSMSAIGNPIYSKSGHLRRGGGGGRGQSLSLVK